MRVHVEPGKIDRALRVLRKKLQAEGVVREMRLRERYEKPSDKRRREKQEGVRRRKKAERTRDRD